MDDLISKQAVSSWLKQYGQDVLHGKYKFSLMYIWKNLMDLPSAEPEIIRCKDCKYMIDTGDDLMCNNAKGWVVATTSDFGCVLAERRTE